VALVAIALLGVGSAWAVHASWSAGSGNGALKVGVLGGPEAVVLDFLAERRPDLGLEVVRYPSAAKVREALASGAVLAASFETQVEIAGESDRFESAGLTVTLPLAFYSRRLRSLAELGPESKVVISTAPLAQGRALLLLFHYNLVGFDPELGPAARLSDVKRNPRGIQLVAVDDAALAGELDRADLVALEYAPAAKLGLSPARRGLAMEDGFSPFAQVLSVRRGEADHPEIAKLLSAYRSAEIKTFILERFQDSVRRPW
jgi:D-methionine transport system substrate-binding protein